MLNKKKLELLFCDIQLSRVIKPLFYYVLGISWPFNIGIRHCGDSSYLSSMTSTMVSGNNVRNVTTSFSTNQDL